MGVGAWLGQMPFVQRNLEVIVIGVIVISILPVVIGGVLRWRRGAEKNQAEKNRAEKPSSK
jgi:membrane protein DedA with SNARE-associated domain